MLKFRDITYADRELVQSYTLGSECRNCDYNFINLMSWQFIYHPQIALHKGLLLIRFLSEETYAYLPPLTLPPYDEISMSPLYAEVLLNLVDHNQNNGLPFRIMGACEDMLARFEQVLPGRVSAIADPSYTDYLYSRESLSSLAGKKLQPKRNHVNRFERTYPHYEYRPLEPALIQECWKLEEQWAARHIATEARLNADDEQHSMRRVFKHWEELDAIGGALLVDNKVVAFTFGGPINYDTFDVCCEKADINYEGAYAMINREFVRHLPKQYTLINREEDLGIEGLRRAKLSYQPQRLLQKYSITIA